jgi:hypothetical protein
VQGGEDQDGGSSHRCAHEKDPANRGMRHSPSGGMAGTEGRIGSSFPPARSLPPIC